MALTIALYWMLFAGSWRPSVIVREMRKTPGAFIFIAALLAAEFITRKYVLGG